MYFCSDIKWWPRSLCICWSSGSVYSVQERRVCVYGDQDGQYTVTIQPCLLLLPPLWPTGPPPPHHFLLPRALTSQLLLQTITAQLQASPPQTPTGGVSPPSAHSRRQRKQGLTSLPMPHPLLISSIFKSPRVSPAGCRHPPNPPLHCTPPPLSPLLNSPISSQYLSPVHKSTKQLRWKNTIKTREMRMMEIRKMQMTLMMQVLWALNKERMVKKTKASLTFFQPTHSSGSRWLYR